jgi:TonB-linked SusC/RagA family outer membrane protein
MKTKSLWILFTFLLFCMGSLMAQTISGTVTDQDGEPLLGVTVLEEGTTNGSISDFDGLYGIILSNPNASLTFSFVGFQSETIKVGDQTTINVVLVQGAMLDEVVVTAIGLEKSKKALPYTVTEIGGADFNTVKETNLMNSLAGKVAGVVLTKSSAGPGSGTRVIIRGNNSITGNNQPLYVVDGIPVDNSGFGGAAGGGTGEYARADYGTGISDINPDDIESISVLKGPNAAALYGSRASNGVILITTKKGTSRKGIGVGFSSSLTFEEPLLIPEYQNEYGQGSQGNVYTDIENLRAVGGSWGAKLDGSNQLYWTGENRAYSAQPDNVKDFFRTGSNLVNTLSLEGGTQDATFRFSYTNNAATSVLPNASLDRHNFNLRGFANLSENLSLDAKVTYFIQDAKNRPVQGTEGIMAYLYDIPRNTDINDLKNYQNAEDFSVRTYTDGTNGNPYWILFNDVNQDTRNRILGFAKATYKITDDLSVFARVGTDFVTQKIETLNQVGHWFYTSGRFNFSDRKTTETNADFLIMYDKQINPDVRFNINLGGNHLYQTFNSIGVSGDDFKIPTKNSVENARNTFQSYTPLREKKINSLYGQASVSYKNAIYLDVTGRNDWSSTLPETNRSYFYPSVGLSLLLNEFFDPSSVLFDLAKLRTSWAQVGGDTGPYQLDIAFNLQSNGYLGLTTLSRPSVRLNPDLKPEKVTSWEIGAEFIMLKNRVYGDLSYYSIVSEDLIMDVPVAAATGYNAFRSNVGRLTNKGFEMQIGGYPVKSKDFSWDVSLNFSTNENKLEELIEGLDNFIFSTTNNGITLVQATVDGGFGDIYGTDFRTDPQGRLIVDENGRPQATSDKVLLGNYQPDWVGGIRNALSYKNVSLNVLVDARIGGQLFSGTDTGLDGSGVSKRTLQYREGGVLVDGVVNVGTPEVPEYQTNTTMITGQEYWGALTGIASNYVYDQDYYMLREVSLLYRIPRSVFENTFIQNATIGLIGRNLIFLSKDIENFDPTSSFSTSNFSQGVLWFNLPSTRSIGFNLNINF